MAMDALIPKEDKADILADEPAPLPMEANRTDTDDPHGFGNCHA